MRKKIILIAAFFVSLVGLFFFDYATFFDERLHVIFCDVGQGEAIFIRTPQGVDILVDGGPNEAVLGCLSSHMPFWDREIELVFLTHPHTDHFVGLSSVFKQYNVTSFSTVEENQSTGELSRFKKVLAERGIKPRFIERGDVFKLSDGVKIETLWPTREYILKGEREGESDESSLSLVQKISYKDFTLLLTGDISSALLNPLIDRVGEFDVLKVPHHGSKTGLDEATFARFKPSLAVISVGKKNRYGHPSSLVLELLKKKGIEIARTDQDGEIEVITDGKQVRVSR